MLSRLKQMLIKEFIHVFRDNRPLGVFDRRDGPIRGLETVWNADLREAIDRFIVELNERGDWI